MEQDEADDAEVAAISARASLDDEPTEVDDDLGW